MRAGLSLAAVAALTLAGCDKPKDAAPQADASAQMTGKLSRDTAGKEAPATPFLDPGDGPVTLAGFRGKPLLVNLWATWCAPCVKELPTLNAIANRVDVGVDVVTISQDMGEPAAVQQFLDARGLAQLPAWIDSAGALPTHYNAQTLPMTVLYDAQGKEVWRYFGDRDWNDEESLKLIAEASTAPQG